MNLSPVSQTGFIYIIWHKETSQLSFFSTSPPCLLIECSNLEKEIFCLPLVLLNKLLPITHCVMYLNIFGKHESFCHFYSTKWNLLFCGTQWKVMWFKKKKKNLSEEMLIPQKQTVRWLSLVLQQVLINVFLIFLLELKSVSMSWCTCTCANTQQTTLPSIKHLVPSDIPVTVVTWRRCISTLSPSTFHR